MALTLEKIGLKNGPPKQNWYFNSSARPWNDGETTEKPLTNRQQTVNKPVTEVLTNRQQTVNKPATKTPLKKESVNKLVSEPITEVLTNRQQTVNKPTTNTPFSGLTGLQRLITVFIYESCKFSQGETTDPLTLEHISFSLKTTPGVVKTTIFRLVEKGCIVRVGFKNGRGGWSRYKLPEGIFHEMLQLETSNKLLTNRQQTVNKLVSEPVTEPVTSSPSSSSNVNLVIKTTTTGSFSFPPEWEQVNFSSLESIGFSKAHLQQLFKRGQLSSEQVQDSINAFSFDLRQNNRANTIRTTPIQYIMGKLGNGEVYAAPANYLTPQEESMKLYVERKKKLEKEAAETEKQAANFAFEDWLKELPVEKKRDLIPKVFRDLGEDFQNNSLRDYFDEQVWPQKRSEIAGKQPMTFPAS